MAFFSDLHWRGERINRAEAVVRAINREEPEWVVFGGDLIRFLCDLPGALNILAQINARRGKLAVLGNRERVHSWRPHEFWIDEYAKAGFTCLVNEPCVPAGPDNPVFVGLDDMRYGNPNPNLCLPFLDSARTVVLLSHSPDAVTLFRSRFAGHLVLSGHTHGGQLRLPLLGPMYTSSAFGRQFDRGWLVRGDGTQLFVTTGVGETGFAMLRRRLLCPPEIVLLTLEHNAQATTVRTRAPRGNTHP
jgi:predicted MPP superfamily phosphohydrolase